MNDLVTVTQLHGVADVRLNRPDKHNALDLDLLRAIVSTGETLCRDGALRAVVLSGSGPSFCAGLDFAAMTDLLEGDHGSLAELFNRDDEPDNLAQRVCYVWKRVPVPVIAAIHGVAYGGGLQLALGADFRIASPDAKLSIMEIRYGLVPDMGMTQFLPDLMPIDRAKALTMTARVLSGAEAAAAGLVTRTAERPLDAALEFAQELAVRSPQAIRATKQLYDRTWRADAATGLRLEEDLQRALIGQPDQVEAVTAALEGRAPRFR